MKIALSFPECSRRGGLERVVLETANYLAARGHDVHLIACRWDEERLDRRVQRHRLKPGSGPAPLPSLAFAMRSRRQLQKVAPDVSGTFGVYCPAGGVVWAGSVHRAWLRISRRQRNFSGRLRQWLNPFHPVTLAFENHLFGGRRYRALIALTAQMKNDLIDLYSIPPDEINVLPNGYSPAEFNVERRSADRDRVRRQLAIGDDQKLILFVANELHRKGLGTLLSAMAAAGHSSEQLLIVGRAPPGGFAAQIKTLGLQDRVRFAGPTDNVAELYAAADLFALPTQYEAWGLVIIEALACGLPVLTSRLAGAAVAVKEGENGLLLDQPTDVAETSAKMRRLLDGQHADPQTISRSVAQYAWPCVLNRYEQILQRHSSAKPGVLLLTDADVFAGTERHILALAAALQREGANVRIGCPVPSPLAERAAQEKIRVIPIAKRGRIDWRAARQIRRLVQSGEVRIVHAHNGRTSLAAAIGLRGLKQSRLIVTQHFLEPAHAKRRGLAAMLSRAIHRGINAKTSRVIAISSAVADTIRQRQHDDGRNITVIHNGLPDCPSAELKPADQVRTELGIDPNAPLIVCAARLEPEKDVATLLIAMQKLRGDFPAAHCVIAGKGSLHDALAAQIKQLGLQQHVQLLGFCPDVQSIIAAADIFALPSLAEPFGLVLLEAMSVGKPVVATQVAGPVEIVEHGVTGMLVPPSDPPALAAALGHLIRNREDADKMGRQGRARFQSLFTDTRMAAAVAQVYREVLQAS
jgi:UDP-glucose:(heptosyl)LPS alpha-1,3-glucosyltransferase